MAWGVIGQIVGPKGDTGGKGDKGDTGAGVTVYQQTDEPPDPKPGDIWIVASGS